MADSNAPKTPTKMSAESLKSMTATSVRVPESIMLELYSAQVDNQGEQLHFDMSLGSLRFRSLPSATLVFNERCEFPVKNLKDPIVLKLRSKGGQLYGKFKSPISKAAPEKPDTPFTLPLRDANDAPAGSLTVSFWVSKWRMAEEHELSNPRVQELGSMQSVRSSPRRSLTRATRSNVSPSVARHFSLEGGDTSGGSGTEGEGGSMEFRDKAIKRVRTLSTTRRPMGSPTTSMTNAEPYYSDSVMNSDCSDIDLPSEVMAPAMSRENSEVR